MVRRIAPQRPHISRKSRASFLARRSLGQFFAGLSSRKPCDWPPHIFGAWQILTVDLAAPEATARPVLFRSILVAHDCVKAQSKRTEGFEADRARLKISQACSRVSNCIKRAPALLRHRLDEKIPVLIQNREIDLETIEEVFTSTKAVFEGKRFRSSESSRTALEALRSPRATEYAMLEAGQRDKVTAGLAEIASSGHQIKSSDVFSTIATILRREKTKKRSLQSRDLRTLYVAQLREIWKMAELKPRRLLNYVDNNPISAFHHFAELVYVGMATPWVSLHKDRRPPVDAKPRLALQRADYRWEISDDHVRNGLKLPFKFAPVQLQAMG